MGDLVRCQRAAGAQCCLLSLAAAALSCTPYQQWRKAGNGIWKASAIQVRAWVQDNC